MWGLLVSEPRVSSVSIRLRGLGFRASGCGLRITNWLWNLFIKDYSTVVMGLFRDSIYNVYLCYLTLVSLKAHPLRN